MTEPVETGVPVLGVNPFDDSNPHSPEAGVFVPDGTDEPMSGRRETELGMERG